SAAKTLSAWSLYDNHVLNPKPAVRSSVEGVEFSAASPDGARVAFALIKDQPEGQRAWFGRIMVCETTTGKQLFQTDLKDEVYNQLAFSPDGRLLAAGGSWTLCVWETTTWQL